MAGTEKNAPLRILALHGYYQSDVVFSGKLGSLRKGFKRDIEFTFIRAPHQARHPEEEDIAEEYGWWFNNDNSQFNALVSSPMAVGFPESVQAVEKIFEEKGPFDGILGFSQGGAFATILCAMQQKKLSPIKFNFVILISGFKSRCESHFMYYDEPINLPSLHVYGTTDKIIPLDVTEGLAALFTDVTKSLHEGGHFIPGKKDIYRDFVQKMIAMKANSSS